MGLRSYIANALIARGRSLGENAGRELEVNLSQHSIDIHMADPDSTDRAWDESLYKRGNVFVDGYANPIKPKVNYHKTLEDPDTVDVDAAEEEGEDGPHVELISSPRYRDYMRQDLISQLLSPREQWRLIFFAILGLGGISLVTLIVSLSAAGAF